MPGVTTPADQQGEMQLGLQQRTAQIVPSTLNREERTVDVVWTTGATVERYDFWSGRKWRETLSLDPKHVRMDRLTSGRAAVLDAHGGFGGVHGRGNQGRVGTAIRADLGNPPTSTLKLSRRPGVREILDDIEDGVLTDVSVGYRIHALTDVTEDKSEEVRDMLATDWEPFEISLVTVGADAGAHVRSQEQGETFPVRVFTRHSEEPEAMPQGNKETPAPGAVPQEPPAPSVDVDKIRSEAEKVGATRTIDRNARIAKLVRSAGLDREFEDRLVTDPDMTFDRAAHMVADALVERQNGTVAHAAPSGAPGRVEAGEDGLDKFKRGIEQFFSSKFGQQRVKHEDGAVRTEHLIPLGSEVNGLRGHRTESIALDYLRRSGKVQHHEMLSREEIFSRAFHTTSDFPNLLEAVMHKRLEAEFALWEGTWRQFSVGRPASDFKALNSYWTGEAFSFDMIEEGGEYRAKSFGEDKASFAVKKYGAAFDYSYELFINDDLGALSRALGMFAQESADLRNRIAWGLVTDNSVLHGGGALFNNTTQNGTTGHDNLLPDGTALNQAGLNLAWLKYADRKGINKGAADSNETLRRVQVRPTVLLVPPQRRKDAMETLGAWAPNTSANVQVYGPGDFRIVEENLLQDGGADYWYVLGDGPGITHFEHAELEGEGESPTISREEQFKRDVVMWKARTTFGIHIPNYRGWLRAEV